jgi:hypothetical protein
LYGFASLDIHQAPPHIFAWPVTTVDDTTLLQSYRVNKLARSLLLSQ